jgi:PIN domain nuclease of toxin-antitoxin system
VRLLLDTHTLLWFLAGDSKLSGTARALVEDARRHIESVQVLLER